MTPNPLVTHPDALIADAAETMARHEVRHLPVVMEDGTVVGMLSETDLQPVIASPAMIRVRSAMKPAVFAVSPDTSIKDVALALADEKIGALPVVEEGRLVGIVSAIDILYAWPVADDSSVHLDLPIDEARFLLIQLKRYLNLVDDELIHTDRRDLQRELVRDEARLLSIAGELERCLEHRDVPAP